MRSRKLLILPIFATLYPLSSSLASFQRVDDHARRELREEVRALLRHDLAVLAEFFQRLQRRRAEHQGDLILHPVHLCRDRAGVGGVALREFAARGEARLKEIVEQVTLEDRNVELPPRVALVGLER